MILSNSIFNQILTIKNKLADSIGNQCNILNSVTSALMNQFEDSYDEAYESSIAESVVPLFNNEAIRVSKNGDSNEYVFSYDYSDQTVRKTIVIENMDVESINARIFDPMIVEEVDVAPKASLSELIDELSQGETFNEAIAKVNELFLINPNVNTSDIMSTISTVQGQVSSDINSLKTQLINISSEGKISNYGWVAFLANVMRQSESTASRGSMKVSSEDFFAFQSFMNTVMQVVSTVVTIVLAALAAIFAGLYLILHYLWQGVSNLLTRTFDTSIEVKPTVSYPGIRGTYFAGNTNFYNDLSGFEYDTMYRICYGSEDVFFYKTLDENGSIKVFCQCQPVLTLHPVRALKFLRDNFTASITPLASTPSAGLLTARIWLDKSLTLPFFNSLPNIEDDDYPFLRQGELMEMANGTLSAEETLKFNLLFAAITRTDAGAGNPIVCDYYSYASDADHPYFGISNALKWWFNVWTTNDDSSTILSRVSMEEIRKMITDQINLMAINDDTQSHQRVHFTDNLGHTHFDCQYNIKPIFGAYTEGKVEVTTFDSSDWRVNRILTFNDDLGNYQTDCIPTEDAIAVPSLDMTSVLIALGVVSAVITSIIVAGKKIISSVRSKKQLRQTRRVSKLNELRDKYLEDVDNKEYKKQYTKALSAYNFKASVFGWGSYDATNGWVNTPSITSSSASESAVTAVNNAFDLQQITNLIK